MKLTIELVPTPLWEKSLHKLLSKTNPKAWADIKHEIFEKEGILCYICNKKIMPLSAHEFWTYDDVNKVQKLDSIHHLCNLCHKVKHLGFWLKTVDGMDIMKEESISEDDIIDHFCKINNCSKEDYEKQKEEAFLIHKKRSLFDWKQEFGKYDKYV